MRGTATRILNHFFLPYCAAKVSTRQHVNKYSSYLSNFAGAALLWAAWIRVSAKIDPKGVNNAVNIMFDEDEGLRVLLVVHGEVRIPNILICSVPGAALELACLVRSKSTDYQKEESI